MTMARRPAIGPISGMLRQINLWTLISLGVLIFVIVLSPQEGLPKLNHLIQDFVVAHQERVPSSDLVIVAIDDKSIAALGRWPWRRAVHAELLDRIGADHPKAIGLDVLFTEPDLARRDDDALLAAAIERNSPVVLPVFIQSFGDKRQIMPPLAPIAEHAAGLGQPHLKVDHDGVVRSTYLLEQVNGQTLQQFSTVLLDIGSANSNAQVLPVTHPANANSSLRQQGHIMIPYAGPVGHFERISSIDVIRGVLPDGTFSNKYVLIGATATSVGDQYATPTTHDSALMPGVEILANITDAMLQGITLRPASNMQNASFNLLFVGIALIGFLLLSPFYALLLTIFLALASVFSTFFLAGFAGILFAPAAGILGLISIYPLWSWHRLNTVSRFLMVEYESLQRGQHIPFAAEKPLFRDFLNRRIAALEGARQQLQNLHQFVVTSLESLPYPTIICDTSGLIRFANQSAAQHFDIGDTELLLNRYLPALMADVKPDEHEPPLISHELITTAPPSTVEGEARDGKGRDLILKCVPITKTDDQHSGWILSLIDISDLRRAERDREEAFRFITHDIRAPLSSIIALLELNRLQNTVVNDHLMMQLEHYADNALALADDFMNLSHAKSAKYRVEKTDLCDLLSEVADEAWAACRKRNIHLKTAIIETPVYAMVDRLQFKRALANLISNAIKFSPDGTEITCDISRRHEYWDVAIIDRGIGIAPELQARIFDPFNRMHATSHPGIKGTGLGLAIVQTIVKRHGGNIEVQSKPGSGSAFHILIPVFVPANQDNTDAEQTADAI